jgi:class 3 adenylate cyclase
MKQDGTVLIVDDEKVGRDVLKMLLVEEGYDLAFAHDGPEALAKAAELIPDLILLDVMMPDMDGFEVCQRLRNNQLLAEVPIIIVTALDDRDSRLRGIQAGANDFVTKPFDRVELRARVRTITQLRRKRMQALKALQENIAETERLLLNVLPRPIADRLKHTREIIADRFDDVTILFADIVGFTKLASQISPVELVTLLNEIFSAFDRLSEQLGLEKIKTIGDKYMVAGGLPVPRADHAEAIAEMALGMQDEVSLFNLKNDRSFRVRVGINTGPVVAGVIGAKKFIYDLWGDTVNIASRMETQGLEGCIQVTESTYRCLQNRYLFEDRGIIHVKNRGNMNTYFLIGRKIQYL